MEQNYLDNNTETIQNQSVETPQTRPENYLVWSILVTVLCCWPLGIPAIVYSVRVDNLWKSGDVEGANEAAKNAKKFCWVSFGIAVLCWLLYFGFIAFAWFMASRERVGLSLLQWIDL